MPKTNTPVESFNPPILLDGGWELVHIPEDPTGEKMITPILRHNDSGALLFTYPIFDKRKLITENNITRPVMYDHNGESLEVPKPILDMVNSMKEKWITTQQNKRKKRRKKSFEDIGNHHEVKHESREKKSERKKSNDKQRGKKRGKEEEEESSNNSDEESEEEQEHRRPSQPKPKKQPVKKPRKKPVNIRTPLTLERLKQAVNFLDARIKAESRDRFGGKGIPFIYKDAQINKLTYRDKKNNKKWRNYRVRAVGAKLVPPSKTVKYWKVEPVLTMGTLRDLNKPTRALKILIATALGVSVDEIPPQYKDIKGYVKLVREDDVDTNMDKLYDKKLRYVTIVTEEQYQRYLQEEAEKQVEPSNDHVSDQDYDSSEEYDHKGVILPSYETEGEEISPSLKKERKKKLVVVGNDENNNNNCEENDQENEFDEELQAVTQQRYYCKNDEEEEIFEDDSVVTVVAMDDATKIKKFTDVANEYIIPSLCRIESDNPNQQPLTEFIFNLGKIVQIDNDIPDV